MGGPSKTPAAETARRLHRQIAGLEQQVAWLEWLLTTKLGPCHKASVLNELRETREQLGHSITMLKVRSC